MGQHEILVRKSPFLFLRRLVLIEFFFALLPFGVAALVNLRGGYEGTFLASSVSYTLFLVIVATTIQVLIIVLTFITWYLPLYVIDSQRIRYRRGTLSGETKLVNTQSITNIAPKQGWIARRLDYGTLIVSSSESDDAVHVKDIPDPVNYVELIQRLVEPAPFEPKPAPDLITSGENQYVEFKSSLMWDYRRQMANKDLYEPVMKNVAAFMNTRGGAVLIGVDDEGAVLGLEPDLKTLRKPNVDGFENVFNMAFNKMIGVEFRRFVDVGFPEIDGKTICVATARPSVQPAYLTHKGTEKFYIRTGNSSQPLSVSKAAQYIRTHFDS